MKEFVDREFLSAIDRGGLKIGDLSFNNCQFVDCGFSLTDDISRRSYANDITIINSHICDSHFGPGVIENTMIDGLTTDDTTTCWGTLFRHVVFRGKIGKFSLCPEAASWPLRVGIQQQFDKERLTFYADTDWALDIAEAHFDELDIVGIPASVIRRDPARHFILERKCALRENWRSRVSSNCEYWINVIDLFLNDKDESTLLVAPKSGSREKQRVMTDGLLELRDLGVLT
jgi:hypothetical protein